MYLYEICFWLLINHNSDRSPSNDVGTYEYVNRMLHNIFNRLVVDTMKTIKFPANLYPRRLPLRLGERSTIFKKYRKIINSWRRLYLYMYIVKDAYAILKNSEFYYPYRVLIAFKLLTQNVTFIFIFYI